MSCGAPGAERIIHVHEELYLRGSDRHVETLPDITKLTPEVRSLRHPHVGGNGMSPPGSGVLARDRANAPRLCFPLSRCRLTQAAYRQAHEVICRAFVSNAGHMRGAFAFRWRDAA
jgi:hypothetical protein